MKLLTIPASATADLRRPHFVILVLASALSFALNTVATALQLPSFQTIHTFTSTDPGIPTEGLTVVGSKLFGVTPFYGTIYSLNFDGSNFRTPLIFGTGLAGDGYYPTTGVTLVGQTLVGTTYYGGANDVGTIYSINTDGSNYKRLYSFSGTDGQSRPDTQLTYANSKLYGATNQTLFSINPDGTGFQYLRVLDAVNEGFGPSPVIVANSMLYGTLASSSSTSSGSVYSMNFDGSNFHIFRNNMGGPIGGLTLVNSKLYGAGYSGGSKGIGSIYTMNLDGSDYQTLYSFTSNGGPITKLVAVGSTLYGTTANTTDPDLVRGSVFSLNLDGSNFQVVHAFTGGSDGSNPLGDLVASGSTLFGTTYAGGVGDGTVFAISIPEPNTAALLMFASVLGTTRLGRRS